MDIRNLPIDGALNELSLIGGRIKTKLLNLSNDVNVLANIEGLLNVINTVKSELTDTNDVIIDSSSDLLPMLSNFTELNIDDSVALVESNLKTLLSDGAGNFQRTFTIPEWDEYNERQDRICYLTLERVLDNYHRLLFGHIEDNLYVSDGALLDIFSSYNNSSRITIHPIEMLDGQYDFSSITKILTYNITEMFSSNSLWLDTIQGLLSGSWSSVSDFVNTIGSNVTKSSNYLKEEYDIIKSLISTGVSGGVTGIAGSLLSKLNLTSLCTADSAGVITATSDDTQWHMSTINMTVIGRGLLTAAQWIGNALLIAGTPIVKAIGAAVNGIATVISNLNTVINSADKSSINEAGLLYSWYGNIPAQSFPKSFLNKLRMDAYPTIIDTGYCKILLTYKSVNENEEDIVNYRIYSSALFSGKTNSTSAFGAILGQYYCRWINGSHCMTLRVTSESTDFRRALNNYITQYSIDAETFEHQSEQEKANSFAISTSLLLLYLYTNSRNSLSSNTEAVIYSSLGTMAGRYDEEDVQSFAQGLMPTPGSIFFSYNTEEYLRYWNPPLIAWYIGMVCYRFLYADLNDRYVTFEETVYFKNTFSKILQGDYGTSLLEENKFIFNINDSDTATSRLINLPISGSNYGVRTDLIYYSSSEQLFYVSISGFPSLHSSYVKTFTSTFAAADWNENKAIYRNGYYLANNALCLARYYPPLVTSALVTFVKVIGIALAIAAVVGAVVVTYKAVTKNRRQAELYSNYTKSVNNYNQDPSSENLKAMKRATRTLSWDTTFFGSSKYLANLSGARFGWGDSSSSGSPLLDTLIANDNESEQANPTLDLKYVIYLISGQTL